MRCCIYIFMRNEPETGEIFDVDETSVVAELKLETFFDSFSTFHGGAY